MSLFTCNKVEDCFDGSRIYEYHLFCSIERRFVEELGKAGVLEYYADFPRPFYRIFIKNEAREMQVKGVTGDHVFKIIYSSKEPERQKAFFEALLNKALQEHTKKGDESSWNTKC